jgi:hypothetical protein
MSSPPFKAAGNAVAIQRLMLENEGWQRDDGVTGRAGASFGDPPP